MAQDDSKFGLWDDPGTGKTLIALALMAAFVHWGNRVIVTMPPILLEQFKDTLKTWGRDFYDTAHFHVLDQLPAKREKLYATWNAGKWPDVLMMSHEMFRLVTSPKKQPINKNTGKRPPAAPAELPIKHLRKQEYNFLVPDEAHVLGNAGTKLWARVNEFLYEHGDCAFLPMTGTPWRGQVEDTYGLIALLTPKVYGSWQTFVRAHCVQMSSKYGMRTVAYDHLDYLHKQLYRKARRVEAQEVLKHLKQPLAVPWPVSLSPAHQALYKRMVKEQMLIIDGEVLDLTSEQKLRMAMMRVVTCPHLYSPAGECPPNVMHEVLDEYMQMTGAWSQKAGKIIVFCWFQETCHMVADYYSRWKDEKGKVRDLRPVILNGQMTDKQKEAAKRAFKTDPRCRVAVVNFLTGGAGLDFQDVCHQILTIEPTGLPHHYRQGIGRVARGKQEKQCVMHIVLVAGTVYQVQYRNFIRREDAIQEVAKDERQLFAFLNGD